MSINIIRKELSEVFKGSVARCLMTLSSVLAFDKYTLYLLPWNQTKLYLQAAVPGPVAYNLLQSFLVDATWWRAKIKTQQEIA